MIVKLSYLSLVHPPFLSHIYIYIIIYVYIYREREIDR